MSAGQRYPYPYMFALADNLRGLFSDAVERVAIAGSVRRHYDNPARFGDETCGDIELVISGDRDAVLAILNARPAFHNISGGQRLIKCELVTKNSRATVPVQLNFATTLNTLEWGTLSNYGWKLLLATGDWEWNRAIVTDVRHGGLKPANITKADGGPTSGFLHRGLVPQSTPTEESVFDLLGIPFVPPHRRHGVTAREIRAQLALQGAK